MVIMCAWKSYDMAVLFAPWSCNQLKFGGCNKVNLIKQQSSTSLNSCLAYYIVMQNAVAPHQSNMFS